MLLTIRTPKVDPRILVSWQGWQGYGLHPGRSRRLETITASRSEDDVEAQWPQAYCALPNPTAPAPAPPRAIGDADGEPSLSLVLLMYT